MKFGSRSATEGALELHRRGEPPWITSPKMACDFADNLIIFFCDLCVSIFEMCSRRLLANSLPDGLCHVRGSNRWFRQWCNILRYAIRLFNTEYHSSSRCIGFRSSILALGLAYCCIIGEERRTCHRMCNPLSSCAGQIREDASNRKTGSCTSFSGAFLEFAFRDRFPTVAIVSR